MRKESTSGVVITTSFVDIYMQKNETELYSHLMSYIKTENQSKPKT